MSRIEERKLKITVISSKCERYRPGDVIYLDGAFVAEKTAAPICLTALSAIYPFIYAARKRLTGEEIGFPDMTFQCPDIPEAVEFEISADEDI